MPHPGSNPQYQVHKPCVAACCVYPLLLGGDCYCWRHQAVKVFYLNTLGRAAAAPAMAAAFRHLDLVEHRCIVVVVEVWDPLSS